MNQWIDAKQFMAMTGLSQTGANKAIAAKRWKKQPLDVRTEKNPNGGRDRYLVLWNTALNQPAIGENNGNRPINHGNGKNSNAQIDVNTGTLQKENGILENSSAINAIGGVCETVQSRFLRGNDRRITELEPPSSNPLASMDAGTFLGAQNHVVSIISGVATDGLAVSIQEPSARYESELRPTEPNPVLPPETQTGTVLPSENLAIEHPHHISEDGEVLHPENFACQIDYVLRLIDKKNQGKKPAQKAAYKSGVLKEYFDALSIPKELSTDWHALPRHSDRIEFLRAYPKLTGQIPAKLETEKALSLTGRKSAVSAEISDFFIDIVRKEGDPDSKQRIDPRRRTLGNYQMLIQKKFGVFVSEKQLAAIVKKYALKKYLKMPLAGSLTVKTRGYWPKVPVASLLTMDGCVPSGVEILINGQFKKFELIRIIDVGSRHCLACEVHESESTKNSIGLFITLLRNNKFVKGGSEKTAQLTIRPDNAPGFNLERVAKEINNRNLLLNHFHLNYKPAKSNTPQDKVQQEAGHNSVHTRFVDLLIREFEDKKEEAVVRKNFKNSATHKQVERLKITLEDVRNSQALKTWLSWYESTVRDFDEDNQPARFAPIQRWNDYLSSGETFAFSQKDIDDLEIYGESGNLEERTLIKDDKATYINFKGKYQIKDPDLIYKAGLKVQVKLLECGELAVFENKPAGGLYLCRAYPLAATAEEKVEKVKKAKAKKLQQSTEDAQLYELKQKITAECGICEAEDIAALVQDGASVELIAQVLEENKPSYEKYRQSYGENSPLWKRTAFMLLVGSVKARLKPQSKTIGQAL